MPLPVHTTVDQWRTLVAFAATGTYAKAGAVLHRSGSAVFDTIQNLSDRLGVVLVETQGRKSQLTPVGHSLLRQAEKLLGDMQNLEQFAAFYASGWEAEIGLAIEIIYPQDDLQQVLGQFQQHFNATHLPRLQIYESVLSQTHDYLHHNQAQLAIVSSIPKDRQGQLLTRVEFILVAHPDHPLAQQQPVTEQQLKQHCQIVIRDSGSVPVDAGWLEAEKRWTVSSLSQSLMLLQQQLGFAWLPAASVMPLIRQGDLVQIQHQLPKRAQASLYLATASTLQPGAALLQQLFHTHHRVSEVKSS